MAGSIVVTTTDLGGRLVKYSIAWTASSGGAVSGNTVALQGGRLRQIKFVPTNGGTQPSNDYAATLLDDDGVDVLAAAGASLSNTAASVVTPAASAIIDPNVGPFTPTISGAGNATNGRIDLYVGP